VEFNYKDGRIQRLTGEAAQRWLDAVNNLAIAANLRYSQSQMPDLEWEWTTKEAPLTKDQAKNVYAEGLQIGIEMGKKMAEIIFLSVKRVLKKISKRAIF